MWFSEEMTPVIRARIKLGSSFTGSLWVVHLTVNIQFRDLQRTCRDIYVILCLLLGLVHEQ